HKDIPDEMKDRCHAIYHMLTISALDRPEWDEEVLRQVGFSDVAADRNFYQRALKERDEFYMPDRMFMIEAKK
ncbi:MAG: SAM-dependent methyltransferase, partial [Lachnospiraceae bacterium]|nr:SAM-dependent methyltransferase [Lachnospiraceae bacterium]